tara:strand:- start:1543 stop:1776 length:234 start_codon:yes stop_codon:yes gene_type:complete
MEKIVKLNLDIMIANLKDKYNISKSKLIKISKKIKFTSKLDSTIEIYKGPVYIDNKNQKYIIMSGIKNYINYALLIK